MLVKKKKKKDNLILMKVKCGTPIFFSAIHSANFCHTSLPPDQKEPDYFTWILPVDFLMKLIVMNAAVLSTNIPPDSINLK